MHDAVVERRQIEADLKLALERSEFELFYQPIMDAPTRRVVGCEALIRWRHPTQGLVPPLTFIPVAEEAGLIDQLGAWVIRQACQDAASWPCDLWVAVNCSARQFRSGQLPRTIAAALTDSGLDAARFEIEITESMLMQRDAETTRQLGEIRALGVSIAIDDFGTGYSSLSYLRDFPVDCVKIDRSFLSSLDQGESSSMIIKAIVAMAGAFGMRTIAEGVEHQWQLDTVASLGCNEVQGYLIGKPAPVADTIERIGPARGAPTLAA
jgi:EAL domain-containing protein (putative c-di-GMP-specific phosphodiesterase class I)